MEMSGHNIIASICITSYNRVSGLKRCLESIDSEMLTKFEIIISEDNSPQKVGISEMVSDFVKKSRYTIKFNSNDFNLGYDRNLEKLVSLAEGSYVIFMSDDDCFIKNSLDRTLDFLERNEVSFVYSPFLLPNQKYLRKYNSSFGESFWAITRPWNKPHV